MDRRRITSIGTFIVFSAVLAEMTFAARPIKAVNEELANVQAQLEASLITPLFDRPGLPPGYRNTMMRPLRKRKIELLREIAGLDPKAKQRCEFQIDMQLARLASEGDAASRTVLDKSAADPDAMVSAMAKLGQSMAAWWTDPTPEAQGKVLADLLNQAHARLADPWLANTLVIVADNGASDIGQGIQARNTVAREMTSPYARAYAAMPVKLNWPLVISGTTPQGKPFSSAAWKGRVVMVDFWATWCQPCMAELPQVIEAYGKYHDQGFEIIGISNDSDRQMLINFLQIRAGIKWPQLFGPSNSPNHWHALTEKFGVDSIPRVYLIDRDGILRTATARGRLDELVPKLLAEKPDPDKWTAIANHPSNSSGEARIQTSSPTSAAPPHATASSAIAPAASAPPATPPTAVALPTADDSTAKATRTLRLAKSYVTAERFDQARTKLQSIVDTYPRTPAAAEANALLKQIEGK